MGSIHNPSNFRPEDYVVVDYFDNKPPEYVFGMPLEAWQAEREWHLQERARLFPQNNCYRCQHCGQNNVRYVVAVDHTPTGARVCFGNECVVRLEFPNQDAFKMAQVKARAEQGNARLAKYKARLAFIEAHPGLQELIDRAAKPEHEGNHFVKDVLRKFDTWGDLSDRQVDAIRRSLDKDDEIRAKRNQPDNRPALVTTPRGRRVGVIVSQKTQESMFGTPFKMLVQLEDGNKIWGTEPAAQQLRKGDKIEFFAPVEVSEKDAHFGFFTRPTKLKLLVPGPNSPVQMPAPEAK